jgi:DNA-binding MarR family transcriptional regulator
MFDSNILTSYTDGHKPLGIEESVNRTMIENADIIDFLQKKGAMELLVEIGEDPKRHTDLREKFLLSSSTLHGRLKRGSQLGLWEQTLKERDDGLSSKVYRLNEKGQEVYDVADGYSVSRYHKTRRDAVRHVRKAEAETLKALSPDDAPWLDEIEPLIEIDRVETQRDLEEFTSDSGES